MRRWPAWATESMKAPVFAESSSINFSRFAVPREDSPEEPAAPPP